MEVRLPNGSVVMGKVSQINVLEQSDVVVTQVRMQLKGSDTSDYITATGSPVDAKIYLKESTLYDNFVKRVTVAVERGL